MNTKWYTTTVLRIRPLKWEAVVDGGTVVYYFYALTKRSLFRKVSRYMDSL